MARKRFSVIIWRKNQYSHLANGYNQPSTQTRTQDPKLYMEMPQCINHHFLLLFFINILVDSRRWVGACVS